MISHADQEKLYSAGSTLTQVTLKVVGSDDATIEIAYVSPGSPVVHKVHLILTKTHSDGVVDYYSVLRDGRKCGSLDLRPSARAGILLADANGSTQAFSRVSQAAMQVQLNALQHTADLQRGYPNKGLIRGYSFLSQC